MPATVETAQLRGQDLITRLSSFLRFVADIHVAKHVDVDGIRQDAGSPTNDLYIQNVEKARVQVRTLEAFTQSIYDDSATLFSLVQKIAGSEPGYNSGASERVAAFRLFSGLSTTLQTNLGAVKQTLEALLAVGHDQAELARGDHKSSIGWRKSTLRFIDDRFGGAVYPILPTREPAGLGDEPAKETQPGIVENGDRVSVTIVNTPVGDAGYFGEGMNNGVSSMGSPSSNIPFDGSDDDYLRKPFIFRAYLTVTKSLAR